MAQQRNGRSRSALGGFLALLLPIVLLLFASAVWAGWTWLLTAKIGAFLALVFAGAIAASMVLLAFVLGLRKAETAGVEEIKGWRWWWALPILLFFSGLGGINAAFYLFQGTDILQENIDRAKNNIGQLEAAAKERLVDSEFAAKRANVMGLLKSLESEMLVAGGDNTCGLGPEAKRIVREIAQTLPKLYITTGSDRYHKCGSPDVKRIHDDYRARTLALMDEDPAYAGSDAKKKDELLASMTTGLGAALSNLEAAANALTQHGDQAGTGSYAPAQKALQEAKDRYDSYYTQLAGISPNLPATLPHELDIESSRNLGSYTSTLSVIWERLDRLSTYFYLFLALLLDVGLVSLIAAVAAGRRRRNWRPASGRRTPNARAARDPEFLWVNQG